MPWFRKKTATPAPTIPESLRLTGTLDLQSAAGEGDKPATFKLTAYTGKPMRVAGFMDPVIIDLAGAKFDKPATPVIADHDTTKRIGHTTRQAVTATEIVAEGVVSSSMGIAHGFVKDAKAGFPFQCSVGADVIEGSYVEPGATVTVNGAEHKGPLIVAKQTLIRELSITVLGADNRTSALAASKPNPLTPEDGTMPTDLQAERVAAINAALTPPPDGWNAEFVHEVETLRSAAIAGDVSTADLITRVRNLTELQARRAEYPVAGGPAIHSLQGVSDFRVLEAALAEHVGLNTERHYGAETADFAHRIGVTSVMECARHACRVGGKDPVWRSKDAVLKAAFSMAEFTSLLENIAGKSLLDAYNAFPSAARQIARKLSANDFKDHTGIRLTGDSAFQKVGKDGEIKHGTLADQSYTYSVATYGRMFGVDRQSIINDDLDGLKDLPQLIGRGAAVALEELFWALVIANTGNFFHATNSNLLTGAGSALSATSLGNAVKLFLEQTDTQGKPIGVTPRFACVPPALKVTADELYASRVFNTATAGTTDVDERKVPSANTFFGKYEPLTAPWIGAAGLSGGSDTAWYLFGDPADVACFGLAYLDNQEVPTIEENPQPFNKLGMEWRGYLDFGVCQLDHRGGVKSAGA